MSTKPPGNISSRGTYRLCERTAEDPLNAHQTVVYEIIQETGKVTPRELYSEYQERVDDPKTKRTLGNYLDKMRHYNLIGANGETKGRTYCAVQ